MIKVKIDPSKSLAMAIILSILFGPLGVLYATTMGAFVLLVVFLIALGAHALCALVLVWLIGCFTATYFTKRHNKKLLHEHAHPSSHG